MTDVPITRYLLNKDRAEDFVIEIPSNWKITFSAVNPASQGMRSDSHCVRVWEMPGSKLRAVFDSITGIRDMAIPLARKMKSEVGNASWSKDSTGSFKSETEVTKNSEFVLDAPADDMPF